MAHKKNSNDSNEKTFTIWKWFIGSEFIIAIAVVVLVAVGYLAFK